MTSIQIDRTDGLSSSTAIKGPVLAATTANITLSGEQTIDGVALVTGDRVLVKDQTSAVDNGIWKVSTGVWSRSKDFSSNRDVKQGTMVNVAGGSTNSGWWEVTTSDPIAIGTTSIAFAQRLQPYDADLAAIAALSTQPYGRSLLTMAASAELRNDLDAPVYVSSIAALRALDTTKDTSAIVTAAPYEGSFDWNGTDLTAETVVSSVTSTAVGSGTETITSVAHGLSTGHGGVVTTAVNGLSTNTIYWVIKVDADNFKLASSMANATAGTAFNLTGTTNFTFKRLVDPSQDIYVIKTGGQLDGSAGAWLRRGSDLGGTRNTSSIRYHRLNDKLLVGQGATRWTGQDTADAQLGYGSWLTDEIGPGGTTSMRYLLVNGTVVAASETSGVGAPYGIVGAVRGPDGVDNNQSIGICGFASGHGTSGSCLVNGGYFEAVKRPGSNAYATGAEFEATNLNSTPISFISPYAPFTQGMTGSISAGAGGGVATNPTSYPVDFGLHLFYNGSTFRTGIIIDDDALKQDGSGFQHAIAMPVNAKVEWFFGTNETDVGAAIYSQVSNTAGAKSLRAGNGAWQFLNTAGKADFQINTTASSVNQINVTPNVAGSPPIVSAAGDDTNISLVLAPKGTGSVVPLTNDAAALGTTSLSWSDLFLASGGVINWASGDVTITHSSNALAFGGASSGYTFDAQTTPAANDGAALGTTALQWSDLFLASGGVINFANGNYTVTHSTGALTFSGSVSLSAGSLGYATGFGTGNNVTQLTSRTTGVTINKVTGAITMFSAAGSATAASFTVTNSTIAATDTIILNQKSGTNKYVFIVTAVAAGSFEITFFTTGGTATDAPVINFTLIKGSAN